MRIYAGLRREDWEHWGEFTTFKHNAAKLLQRAVRQHASVYCSPLVDPWQPAEEQQRMMPAILEALAQGPPRLITFQTRSPGIMRDLDLLLVLARKTDVRVSFSITTDRDDVRRMYEPHCETNPLRLAAIRQLTAAGIRTFATLAPILPCNPEMLVEAAAEASAEDFVGDPLHIRATKRTGATTRPAAARIAAQHGHEQWFEPAFQNEVVERIRAAAHRHGRRFETGPEGFSWLSQISR